MPKARYKMGLRVDYSESTGGDFIYLTTLVTKFKQYIIS